MIEGIPTNIKDTVLKGKLMGVKHKKVDSDWKIVKIGHVVCLGNLPNINIGAIYTLTGEFKQNEKKGYAREWQFHFRQATFVVNTKDGMANYLAKECPEIGEYLAQKLIDKYESKVIPVLANDIDRACIEVKGFPRNKREKITAWAKEEMAYSGIKRSLYALGLKPAAILKLIKEYGKEAETKVRSNPFGVQEIDGIGFKTADAISLAVGLPRNSVERIQAGIKYTVENASDFGHTCFMDAEVIKLAALELSLDQATVAPVLERMVSTGNLLNDSTSWDEYMLKHGIEL